MSRLHKIKLCILFGTLSLPTLLFNTSCGKSINNFHIEFDEQIYAKYQQSSISKKNCELVDNTNGLIIDNLEIRWEISCKNLPNDSISIDIDGYISWKDSIEIGNYELTIKAHHFYYIIEKSCQFIVDNFNYTLKSNNPNNFIIYDTSARQSPTSIYNWSLLDERQRIIPYDQINFSIQCKYGIFRIDNYGYLSWSTNVIPRVYDFWIIVNYHNLEIKSEMQSFFVYDGTLFNFSINSDYSYTISTNNEYVNHKWEKNVIIPPIYSNRFVTTIGDEFMRDFVDFDYEIYIPNTITKISNNFLYGCESFNQTLTLSDSINQIGDYFLANCTSFNQSLTIPKSINMLIGQLFMYCNNSFVSDICIECSANMFNTAFYPFTTSKENSNTYLNGFSISGNTENLTLMPLNGPDYFRNFIAK